MANPSVCHLEPCRNRLGNPWRAGGYNASILQSQSRLMRYICKVDEELGCRWLAARARRTARPLLPGAACVRSPLIAASVTFALKADVSSDGLYYWVMFWPTYAVA